MHDFDSCDGHGVAKRDRSVCGPVHVAGTYSRVRILLASYSNSRLGRSCHIDVTDPDRDIGVHVHSELARRIWNDGTAGAAVRHWNADLPEFRLVCVSVVKWDWRFPNRILPCCNFALLCCELCWVLVSTLHRCGPPNLSLRPLWCDLFYPGASAQLDTVAVEFNAAVRSVLPSEQFCLACK